MEPTAQDEHVTNGAESSSVVVPDRFAIEFGGGLRAKFPFAAPAHSHGADPNTLARAGGQARAVPRGCVAVPAPAPAPTPVGQWTQACSAAAAAAGEARN